MSVNGILLPGSSSFSETFESINQKTTLLFCLLHHVKDAVEAFVRKLEMVLKS